MSSFKQHQSMMSCPSNNNHLITYSLRQDQDPNVSEGGGWQIMCDAEFV